MLDQDPKITKVVRVEDGTPAAKAGLKADDLILSIDGKTADTRDALFGILQRAKPGDLVTVKVKRDEEEKEFKITLAKRPPQGMMDALAGKISTRRGGF